MPTHPEKEEEEKKGKTRGCGGVGGEKIIKMPGACGGLLSHGKHSKSLLSAREDGPSARKVAWTWGEGGGGTRGSCRRANVVWTFSKAKTSHKLDGQVQRTAQERIRQNRMRRGTPGNDRLGKRDGAIGNRKTRWRKIKSRNDVAQGCSRSLPAR